MVKRGREKKPTAIPAKKREAQAKHLATGTTRSSAAKASAKTPAKAPATAHHQTYPGEHLPALRESQETALATTGFDQLHDMISEMRHRIKEAERRMTQAAQAAADLKQEVSAAETLAKKAEEELVNAAKKAVYFKQEARTVRQASEHLQQNLIDEQSYWQHKLAEEKRLLHNAEHKLQIATEEAERISHAKQVAEEMAGKEMWRIGSSKQGVWLQRRKLQGNSVSMSRNKSGAWNMPQTVARPGATYGQTMLEQEIQRQNARRQEHNPEEEQRLRHLATETAEILSHAYTIPDEEQLSKLAAQEAELHYSSQQSLLAEQQKINDEILVQFEEQWTAQLKEHIKPPQATEHHPPAKPVRQSAVEQPHSPFPQQTAQAMPAPPAPASRPAQPAAATNSVQPPAKQPGSTPQAPEPMAPIQPQQARMQAQPTASTPLAQSAVKLPTDRLQAAPPTQTGQIPAQPQQTQTQTPSQPTSVTSPVQPPVAQPGSISQTTPSTQPEQATPSQPQQARMQAQPTAPTPSAQSAVRLPADKPQTPPPTWPARTTPVQPSTTPTSTTPTTPAEPPVQQKGSAGQAEQPSQQSQTTVTAEQATPPPQQKTAAEHTAQQPTGNPSAPQQATTAPVQGVPQTTAALPVQPAKQPPVDAPETAISSATAAAAATTAASGALSSLPASTRLSSTGYRNNRKAVLRRPGQKRPDRPSQQLAEPPAETAVKSQPDEAPSKPPAMPSGQTIPVVKPSTPEQPVKQTVPPQTPTEPPKPLATAPQLDNMQEQPMPQTVPVITGNPQKAEAKQEQPSPQPNPEIEPKPAAKPAEQPSKQERATVIPLHKEPRNIPEESDDPLEKLVRQAAAQIAARERMTSRQDSKESGPAPYRKNPQEIDTELNAAAKRLQAQENLPPKNSDTEADIQRLTKQANLNAQQHQTLAEPPKPSASHSSIAQKVAEETGRHDNLLKEQQAAEQAINAAMAAARKAAESAMSISEQISKQAPVSSTTTAETGTDGSKSYSAERLIADALAKAVEAEKNRQNK